MISRCEADPEALAKYVLALIKKDKSEADIQKNCTDQLEVFLTTNTGPFVKQLFKVLSDKSYLKKKKSPPPQENITESRTTGHSPDGLPGSSSTAKRKRSPDSRSPPPVRRSTRGNDSRADISRSRRNDSRPSDIKGSSRRVHRRSRSRSRSRSPPPRSPQSRSPTPLRRRERRRSRSRSPRSRSPPPVRNTKRRSSRSPDQERTEPSPALRKERCRNYHEKGVCLEGDLCPFDHGSDPVVLDAYLGPAGITPGVAPVSTVPSSNINPNQQQPSLLSTPQVQQTTTGVQPQQPWTEYDPSNPSINVPPSRPALLVPPNQQQMNSWNGSGGGGWRGPPPQQGTGRPNLNLIVPEQHSRHPSVPVRPGGGIQSSVTVVPINQQEQPMSFAPRGGRGGFRGGHRGRGGFRGRGGHHHAIRQDPSEKTTLELRRLPEHLNNISALNEYFSKFGQIVNINVKYGGDAEAALVQFATHTEALRAHRCEEAVLGNRFIKQFWHSKEQEKVDPTPQRSFEEEEGQRPHRQNSEGDDGSNSLPGEDAAKKPSVKERLDFSKAVGARGEEGQSSSQESKPAKPPVVFDPKLLRKKKQPPEGYPPAPIIKTRSEMKREKQLQKMDLTKKTEALLEQLRSDSRKISGKLCDKKVSQSEKEKLKVLFNDVDKRVRQVEEDLKNLLKQQVQPPPQSIRGGRGRGRGFGRGGRGGITTAPILEEKKLLDNELEEISIQKDKAEGESSTQEGQGDEEEEQIGKEDSNEATELVSSLE